MKRFILVFTAFMFLANTFATSAWAKPCINMNEHATAAKTINVENTPCHDAMKETQDNQKSRTKHCDGVCLCFHASINQTPVLNNHTTLEMPLYRSEQLMTKSESVYSLATPPPHRPPKLNS